MDIAYKFHKDGQEMARVYRNIDPESILVVGGKIYFAHFGCWYADTFSGRYQLPAAIGPDYITTDPVEIGRIREQLHGSDYGVCVETLRPDPVPETAPAT